MSSLVTYTPSQNVWSGSKRVVTFGLILANQETLAILHENGAKLFNMLPPQMRQTKDSNNFKTMVKNWIHSLSKCLVWVKKCCHIWLDQNFDPSLLIKKLWPFYMRMKQKNFFFSKKKISKWPTEKKLIFQNRQFSKIFRENFMDWSLG